MYWVYGGVGLATLVYLIVDIYPSIKSLEAIITTKTFWILWLIFTIINEIAWGILQVSAAEKIKAMVPQDHPELVGLIIIILSTLCTLTILQSLTIKIADQKF